MKRSRFLALIVAALLVLTMAVPSMAEGIKEGEPVRGGTITISDYFDPPPAVNGNVLTTSGTPGSMEYCYDRLVEYAPVPVETYTNFLAESFEQDADNRTIVKIRQDAKWSDGSALTAKDVVCNYQMRYMAADAVWQYLTSVEALDDYTVAFTWHTYSNLLPRMAFNLRIEMPYDLYGKWADQAAQYIPQRTWDEEQQIWSDSDENLEKLIALREECYQWLPDITTVKTSGAYSVESVNANEMMLKRNENYYNNDKVYIDNVRIQRYVSAEAYLSTVMQGGYDTEPHGLTPDLFKQLEGNNPDMTTMWVPDLGQPAFEFNVNAYPLNIPQVRQAIAYTIDRELLLEIAEPGTMEGDYYATGLTPLWRDAYLTEEMKSELNLYMPDAAKADELLTSIGWSRGSDNYWYNEKGELVEIEVASMNSWPIFFACGEAASLMLDEYGIKSTFNAMELSSYWKYINDGSHQICCDFRGGTTQRGPWEAYSDQFLWSNSRVGLNPQGSPSNMVIEVTKLDGTVVNLRNELANIFYGDEEVSKASIVTLMKMCNEQLFILPFGEKYAPMKIHNPKLAGYPLDPNDPLWYMGHMRAYGRLLKTGHLYFTELA